MEVGAGQMSGHVVVCFYGKKKKKMMKSKILSICIDVDKLEILFLFSVRTYQDTFSPYTLTMENILIDVGFFPPF